MSERVEIRLRRVVKPTAGAFCLLLRRAELAVRDLDVEIAGYVEDSPDGEEPRNLTYGETLVFLGNSWARGKQIVVVARGADAEEAAEKMRARLDREPPGLLDFWKETPQQRRLTDRLEKQDKLWREHSRKMGELC